MAKSSVGIAGWGVAGLLLLALIGRCGGDPPAANDLALSTASTAAIERTLYVRAASLNCRLEPTMASRAVESLPDGLLVGVVREEAGWSLLDRAQGCWVRSSYLGASPRPPEPIRALSSPPQRLSSSSPRRAASSGAFANCSAARAAGAAPVYAGDPGYARRLDRDGDGVGCE